MYTFSVTVCESFGWGIPDVKLLVSAWSSQEDSSSVTVQQEDPSPEVKVTVDSYQTIAVIF